MRLGLLKVGQPPPSAAGRFGSYPDMFRALLGTATFDYRVYAANEGELPSDPTECAGYLITGSAAGAYEPLPWIGELTGFLQAARGRAALVGVCFGHQIMAQAFGGKVIKSPKGWGLGEQEYAVLRAEPWMDSAKPFRLPASHQDQVVEVPPGAEVVAGNAFNPIGALAWRDQRAMSLQLHPEFDPSYASALIESRRGTVYPDAMADRAIASYGRPDDRARVGLWLRTFLTATP